MGVILDPLQQTAQAKWLAATKNAAAAQVAAAQTPSNPGILQSPGFFNSPTAPASPVAPVNNSATPDLTSWLAAQQATESPAAQQYSYTGPSGAEMASAEFAPQYAALEALKSATKGRYDTAYKDVGSMYDALSKDQRAQTPLIQQRYDTAGGKLKSIYDAAANGVLSGVARDKSQTAALMAQLGIADQGLGTALASQDLNSQQNLFDLASRSSAEGSYNTTQGVNEVDYSNRTADTDALAGKNSQSDLTRLFQSLAAQQDAQGLNLHSQEAQSANQYGLSISKLQQDAIAQQNSYTQQGLANQYKEGQLSLDSAKFDQQITKDNQAASLAQQNSINNSGDTMAKVSSAASQMWPENSGKAASAVDLINTAYATYKKDLGAGNNPGNADISAFLKYVQYNVGDITEARQLTQLGTLFWQSLGNAGGSTVSSYGKLQ